jgi:hypothetical protein
MRAQGGPPRAASGQQRRSGRRKDPDGACTENRKVGGSTPPLATLTTSVLAGQAHTLLPSCRPANARSCPLVAMIGRSLSHVDRTRGSSPVGSLIVSSAPPLPDVLPTRAEPVGYLRPRVAELLQRGNGIRDRLGELPGHREQVDETVDVSITDTASEGRELARLHRTTAAASLPPLALPPAATPPGPPRRRAARPVRKGSPKVAQPQRLGIALSVLLPDLVIISPSAMGCHWQWLTRSSICPAVWTLRPHLGQFRLSAINPYAGSRSHRTISSPANP